MMFLENAIDPQFELILWVITIVCILPIAVLALIVFIKLIIKNQKNRKALKEAGTPEVKLEKGKKNKKQNTTKYLTYFGSENNIVSVSKNLTRVTVEVKELEKVDLEGLKKEGVGILITGNVIKCSSQAFANQIELK